MAEAGKNTRAPVKSAPRSGLRRVLQWVAATIVAIPLLLIAFGWIAAMQIDFSRFRDQISDVISKKLGVTVTITGELKPSIGLRNAAVSIGGLTVANPDGFTSPYLAKIDSLTLSLDAWALMKSGGKNIVVKEVSVDGLSLNGEINAHGKANWELLAANAPGAQSGAAAPAGQASAPQGTAPGATPQPAPAPQAPAAAGAPALDLAKATVTNGQFTFRDGTTGAVHAAKLTRLDIAAAEGKPVSLSVRGAYEDQPLALDMQGGPLADLMASKPWPVSLTASALGLSPKMSAQFLRSADSFTMKGFTAKLGSSDLAGDLSINLAGKTPKLTAAFASRKLDLADLSPQIPATAKAAAQQPAANGNAAPQGNSLAHASDTELPFDMLKKLDADLRFTADSLAFAGQDLGPTQGVIELRGGRLDGELNGRPSWAAQPLITSFHLDARQAVPSAGLKWSGTGVDLGAVSAAMGAPVILAAPASIHIDLAGRGTTPAQIIASASGQANLIIDRGVLNVDALPVAYVNKVAGLLPSGMKQVELSCFKTNATLVNGIASVTGLGLDSNLLKAGGQGTIDLARQLIDLNVLVESKQAALGNIAVPLQITGNLASPTYGVDPAAAVSSAADAAASILGGIAQQVRQALPSFGKKPPNPCRPNDNNAAGGGAPPAAPSPVVDGNSVGGAIGGALKGLLGGGGFQP